MGDGRQNASMKPTDPCLQLEKVTAVFDEEPKSFPVGFSHDVSLVDTSGVSDIPRTFPYATDLTWLSQQEGMDIKPRNTISRATSCTSGFRKDEWRSMERSRLPRSCKMDVKYSESRTSTDTISGDQL